MSVLAISPFLGASALSASVAESAVTTATTVDLVADSRRLQSLLSGGTLSSVRLNAQEWTKDAVFETIVTQFLSTMEMNGLDLPPREKLTRDTLNAEFLPDSTARLELVVNLQTEFGLEDIPGEEAETLKTIGAAVDYIASKLGVTE